MRVMGVDPGLTRCGIALVESGAGRSVVALDVDVVRTPSDMDLADRLLAVHTAAVHWINTHHPDVVAVERVFAQNQVSTAMGTAQAAGVVALAAAQNEIPVRFHTPSEVKAAVTGSGRADKAQVTSMVTRILGMQTRPRPADAADALALAITHCWRGPMLERMAEAERRAKAAQRHHQQRIAQARAAAQEVRK
ncbi:crossover junction endodeoxyribonuclease RuvC [Gordonia effusa NBRC 100432]|uniref:Crossover junction endodeoxyribonuclease RuvC n=1 Tax=Gordonia effusa NBRC 100432 TaxID=1077974 RepID=H0QZL7_9ACTN|nr:crossover junction endodeoxyribonuclease RuvC [Gordonia effusa]GAB18268.1 crossover junction endodeoxyribonuclease RuvC [Gordonia effusa NBRC 100432]